MLVLCAVLTVWCKIIGNTYSKDVCIGKEMVQFELEWRSRYAWADHACFFVCVGVCSSFRSHCHSPPAEGASCRPWKSECPWTLGPPNCHPPIPCCRPPRRPHFRHHHLRPHQSRCLPSETAGKQWRIMTTTVTHSWFTIGPLYCKD